MTTVVLAAGTLALSACGGSGNTTGTDDSGVERLEGILERFDTFLVPSVHLHYSFSVEGGGTLADRTVERVDCTGGRCTGDDGTELSVQDMIDSIDQLRSPGVDIGSRSGFETAIIEEAQSSEFATIPTVLSVTSNGFWGEHGYGQIIVVDGPVEGRFEGALVTGNYGSAVAAAGGSAAGTNPTGMGSATWSGIAEAASLDDFQRYEGTATVTIADLSDPRVGIDIEISGQDIGPPEWDDMPLVNGRFTSGAVDTGDYLEGNFHGPDHSETYGVFDTGAYVGAFGAKRNQ